MEDERMNTFEVPAEWLEAIAQGEADLREGRTVAIEPVLEELRASLDRMGSKRVRTTPDAA